MVGLNGSALPYEDFSKPAEFNGTHTPTDTKETPPRRARLTQSVRGPKPLLPRSLKEALQLAELLSKSKLIPKGFETPETCLVGILYGMEVGLSPIAALQRMAVIDGRPTIWGDAALALVQASGLLQSIKEEIVDDKKAENTISLTAICSVRREGRSEPVTGTFSVEDAKRAGLWQKPGPWTDYPKRMLMMRARAFALRDAFPDVLAGLYIREEFECAGKRYEEPSSASSNANEEWTDSAITPQSLTPTDLQATKPHDDGQLQDHMRTVRRAPPPPPVGEEIQNIANALCNRLCERTHEEDLHHDLSSSLASQIPPLPLGPSAYAIDGHQNRSPQISDCQTVTEFYPSDHLQILSFIDRNPGEALIGPEIVLDLFDNALCCALDRPTLEEIVDDFAGRLRGLSQDYQRRAQKVIDRHQRRVDDLDRCAPSMPHEKHGRDTGIETGSDLGAAIEKAELSDQQTEVAAYDLREANGSAEDPLSSAPQLPRGLKALLPNLGLGAPSMMRPRRQRQSRLNRSLASWNAHSRLAEFKSQNHAEEESVTDKSETEE